MRNQNNPQYCQSSWAHAVISTLSDRIKIMKKAQFNDVNLSPQILLSCLTSKDDKSCNSEAACNGCKGGDPYSAWKYIKNYGITDETCSSYLAWGHSNGLECTFKDENSGNIVDLKCYTSFNSKDPLQNITNKPIYKISEYYRVTEILSPSPSEQEILNNEQLMLNEIQENGPISCGIYNDESFENFIGSNIFNDSPKDTNLNYEISIIGWGIEHNAKYWIIRNSVGSFWGDQGYAKIPRGKNFRGIESDCSAAIPIKTWTEINFLGKNKNNLRASYPDNWFWGNVNGINYLSWDKNQHIPKYCGSCWAQSTTSALSDRFNILLQNKFPQINLNSQVVLNCDKFGTCHGGDSILVYQYAKKHGIPDNSCEQYIAESNSEGTCHGQKVCKICSSPVPGYSKNYGVGNCSEVKNFRKYYVKKFGRIAGEKQMKEQIYHHGPITCGIHNTDEFHKYRKGLFENDIFKQHIAVPIVTHFISIVGWGVTDENEKYWIGRNSWGTFWGLDGYFKLPVHGDNLGLGIDCGYAIPTLEIPKSNKEYIPF